ncbi:D-alanyl-D-alanine carboxypeptidase [Pannonibacter phragmitetus]|uniref:D-alanyl-D-alanine carboxypeptidase n=1 Tax=Pannonibacter phragmitetus TaxID=121719 RepID=UPI001FFCCC1D|nr:D-alanyl-D-alanine carboxypeptidase [Pannonibacter phragmitetus]
MVDAKTGKTLYSASADELRFPASLTKVMTLYIVFEELEAGRLRMDTPLKVSAYAAARPPSKLGLRPGSTIQVRDAILALVTKSANDVAAVVAENIGGSEARFADRMTRTARQIGMSKTTFKNPHGLPNAGQRTTARDMATLGRAIQDRFPKHFELFKTRSFTYQGRTHGNHNRLLGAVPGVSGIKTGYINASGFNLVTSVERDGRQIVAVVMGGNTGRSRDAQMVKLINEYMPKASRGPRTAPLLVHNTSSAIVADAKPTAPIRVNAPLRAPVPNSKPDSEPAVLPFAVASAADAPAPVPVPAPAPAVAAARTVVQPQQEIQIASADGNVALPSPAPAIVVETSTITPGISPKPSPRVAAAFAVIEAAPVETVPAPETVAHTPARATAAEKTTVTVATNNTADAAPGWQVQIGAAVSETAAIGLLKKAQAATGSALRNRDPYTEEVTAKGQTMYRARFVGFQDKNQAQAACQSLKRAKFNCYTIYQ